MWVLVPPQGRSTGEPLVAAFPFCSTKSLPAPMTCVWKLCLIILLCATSRNAQHSRDLVIIGSSGHRGEGARRLSEWIRPCPTRGRRLSARHISYRTASDPLPPPHRLMVVKSVSAHICARLGEACCHVKSIRGRKHAGWGGPLMVWGRGEAKGKKRSFLSPACTVLSSRTC